MDLQKVPVAAGPYTLDVMGLDDLPQVIDIERRSFSEPWPPDAYRHEITSNPRAHYLVVRMPGGPDGRYAHEGRRPWSGWAWWRAITARSAPVTYGPVAGFAGLWLLVDEAHISNIAVRPDLRGLGLGELLLVALIDRAYALSAAIATLEVRVSNSVAQALYVKYEFEHVGRRKRYYRDNGEDADIMTVPALNDAYYERFTRRKRELLERLKAQGVKSGK